MFKSEKIISRHVFAKKLSAILAVFIAALMVLSAMPTGTNVQSIPITAEIGPVDAGTQTPIALGTAGNFAILAKSGISTTGTTAIVGDIGVSPIAATAITGFGLTMDASNQFSTSSLVTGHIYAADYAVPTPTLMTTAISDMQAAFTNGAGRTSPDGVDLGAGNIGGMTFTPGLYKWSSIVTITNDITLSGSATDVWIFQIATGLVVSSAKQILLTGGAKAENIFWIVGTQATLGTTCVFNGNILAGSAIVLNSGASLHGRALAQTAVTLIANAIAQPSSTLPTTSASTPAAPASRQGTVNLGTAANFVILAKAGITTTGSSAIAGNIGVSPIAAASMTGFGLTMDSSNQFAKSSLVTGKVFAANYAVPTPAIMTTAISDMEAAYTEAAGRPNPDGVELGAGNIGGRTFAPGIYKWSSVVTIDQDITLSGSANDVWIFQIAQGCALSPGKHVLLSGGAQAKNVFWQVAGVASFGANSVFSGNVLCATGITFIAGAMLEGRCLAQTSVTLIDNSISMCLSRSESIPTMIIPTSGAAEAPIDLGTAGNFAILAKSGISTTGTTAIVGAIGVSPIAATAITGFGLTMDASNQFSTSSLVTGHIYAADYAVPTPNVMTTAISDMEAAFVNGAGRINPDGIELGDGNIGGMTFTPGLYKWSSVVTITNDITLSGSATDIWIFQISTGLVVSSAKEIILTGGAKAENVFWIVGTQATLGTTCVFNGNILAGSAVVLNSGASLHGRALAQTAVTLIANAIAQPVSTLPTITKSNPATPASVQSPVNLGTAANFVILAKTGITTTGSSAIAGNIGVSPIAAASMTGFGLQLDISGKFAKSALVTGKVYAADYAAPTPSIMTTAISDMEAAYTDAAGRVNPDATELGAGDISGMTFAPGLYKWSSVVTIYQDIILSGSENDVWIFQCAQGLSIAAGKHVILSGSAQAKNVFWQVAGVASFGADSVFSGNVLCATGITFIAGATMEGRCLAQTSVTLISNTISMGVSRATSIPTIDVSIAAEDDTAASVNGFELNIMLIFGIATTLFILQKRRRLE